VIVFQFAPQDGEQLQHRDLVVASCDASGLGNYYCSTCPACAGWDSRNLDTRENLDSKALHDSRRTSGRTRLQSILPTCSVIFWDVRLVMPTLGWSKHPASRAAHRFK